ncbi:tRNA (N6-isopentenyl adenosine(37)-C2)-methylthiotransferase MiaB [Geotalea uraniireducens]|uniref:tRNA-2-methylthio-N(6)-dimethylallyladenosine synthase n=1 Tax=Geotalea uraniireducens (strain Rf4) TaxID=351605 RepID=MIAB_GEOUR|nr:tRNA (N6-isopentenyl adenosine(37)-C2)-methylthiotransferase MiaB [Geotalea uraniireducens]A5G670.1 RecName: Full=tRNA-2-methylthio-N(6)-dimethylallyladenosine synthase; AltName: Full=(Dimethylallyl)adenosine tRNA methylthiotransferase MiaB; AltName: Full=tRNA-i(6)A37 methylthiotransferase [Geotalea uraniireducens Rf4]ABQ27288.1 tRNA-i(6)A37 thiotransferase enzyme MiaB [Geotalea uraniireducens Rf4]
MTREKLLYLETFGCQMNVSDSEKIAALLKGIGYFPTQDSSQADLVILNTCSVRAKAEEKVYNHLVQYKGLKRKKPGIILGVGGCVAQQEGERLLANVPHLDIVFGTHNLHLLPELVRAAEKGERLAEVGFIDNETRLDLFPVDERTDGVSRFVTVMQGCENFCSYCIVPYVRGREISRRSADILGEVRGMAGNGVKEVTLLGQNVNSYGLKSSGEMSFIALLREVSLIPGIERIRFTTSHPKDFSQPLIDCFAEIPKLCRHIHLPAQSGSNAVLAAMNRGYTREEYLGSIARLKAACPSIQITGDIIVGFPGETEEDFQATLSLMEEVRYTDVFSFIYSKRPETKAAGYADEVGQDEKQGRLSRLLDLQRRITLETNKSFVGTVQQVLIEGESRRGGQFYGRTSGNRVVNLAADVSLVGSIVNVMITRGDQNSLQGELCR